MFHLKFKISVISVISVANVFGLSADINKDGIVNLSDFGILSSQWLMEDNDMGKFARPNGENEKITVLNDVALDVGTGDFSICFWIKNASEGCGIFSKIASNVGCWLEYYTATGFEFRTSLGVSAYIPFNTGSDVWKHVTISRSGSVLYAYVNAQPQAVDGVATAANMDNAGNLILGGNSSLSLDDFRIYKKVLSAAEVAAIYNNGLGTKINLAADGFSWGMDFDIVSGSTVVGVKADSVQLNGTITGGVTIADGGVPFADTSASIATSIQDAVITRLIAMDLFRTVDRWKHQIGAADSGSESFNQYAPFAFVKCTPATENREGDYDLRRTFNVAIAIGGESKDIDVARSGSATELGVLKMADLIIKELDNTHPGEAIACDDMHLVAEEESIDRPKKYAMELMFEINYMM